MLPRHRNLLDPQDNQCSGSTAGAASLQGAAAMGLHQHTLPSQPSPVAIATSRC